MPSTETTSRLDIWVKLAQLFLAITIPIISGMFALVYNSNEKAHDEFRKDIAEIRADFTKHQLEQNNLLGANRLDRLEKKLDDLDKKMEEIKTQILRK